MTKFATLGLLAVALVLGIAIESEAGPLRRLFGARRGGCGVTLPFRGSSCSGGSCAVR